MTTYTDTKIITLTSQSATQKRNGTYLSNIQFEMGQFLKDEPDIIHRQITLASAQIPYSFYVINETNNIYKGMVNLSNDYTCVIPTGNYTANSLCAFLNNYIAVVQLFPSITFSVNKINGKLSMKYPNPTDDPNQSLMFRKESTCQDLFGYEKGIDYYGIQVFVSGGLSYVELLSPFALNLLGIKLLQVRSSILNMTNYSSVHNGITTLLQTIPVSCVPFGMIDYVDKGDNKISFSNRTLDELDIEILDGESGAFINFNNQDWTMTLTIHITKLLEVPTLPTFKSITTTAVSDLPEKQADLEKPIAPNKDIQELNLLTQ